MAIGSAIANDRYRDRGYYDRGYYGPRGYYDGGYYGPRYRGGWNGYYAPPRRFYRQRCFTRWQFDPYIGREVRVRYC